VRVTGDDWQRMREDIKARNEKDKASRSASA